MSINRNAPCPCGSGKKYKKCCLNNQKVIQLTEILEDRFFQQKEALVNKIKVFIEDKISFNDYLKLNAEFSQRSNHILTPNVSDGFFQFWLFFCHRFSNGLRGIEWFFHEQQTRLPLDERNMAEVWRDLSLKLVEAVDKQGEYIIFEDFFSKEKFMVADSRENVPVFIPWYATLGFLERYNEKYYFNGVRKFEGPINFMQGVQYVQNLMETEKLNLEQVLFDYYPEILSALAGKQLEQSQGELKYKELREYFIEYKILNAALLEKFFQNHKDFIVNEENRNIKKMSWSGNWRVYRDSELNEEIFITDMFASISIEKNILLFNSSDKQKADEFKSLMKKAVLAVEFVDEKVTVHKLPADAVIKNSFVQMSQEVPKYFSIYANTDLLSEINVPIPKYNGYSIRQLVDNNNAELAKTWLKNMEYTLYQVVLQDHQRVDISADLNTVRKELDLPLSPFVTGGESRHTEVEYIKNPFQKTLVPEEDIPFYEELGFIPSTINNFYAEELVSFFKEKTIGKADGTVRKYRNSLYFLREGLENTQYKDWQDCVEAFWKKVIVDDLLEENYSKTFQKDFFSTIKTLTKWIDTRYTIDISKIVLKVLKEAENHLAV